MSHEYGGAQVDSGRAAVELLRKDVHRMFAAVQQLGDKIGNSFVLAYLRARIRCCSPMHVLECNVLVIDSVPASET